MIRSSFRLCIFILPFALGSCDWANEHMPVIGERCENWQCFTQSGQQQSELIKQQKDATQRQPANAAPPDSALPSPPAQPLAPSAPAAPTYTYVPRAAPAPGTTPFEGNIQPTQ